MDDIPFPVPRTDVSAADWWSRQRDESHVDVKGRVLTIRPIRNTPFGRQNPPFSMVINPSTSLAPLTTTERRVLRGPSRDWVEDKMLMKLVNAQANEIFGMRHQVTHLQAGLAKLHIEGGQ